MNIQATSGNIKKATEDSAADIAYLTNLAGEGLAAYLWGLDATKGCNAFDVGTDKARRSHGNFSFRNAWILEYRGKTAGMLLAMPQPAPYPLPDFNALPPQVQPLIELESRAPGSFYVNALGVYEHFQGMGFGKALMAAAEQIATEQDIQVLSLIVASENRRASSLYHHLGYREIHRLPIVGYPGRLHGGDWVLMTKSLDT
jgi:ribosomal protein S18 acetylase RimI-like enzyme